MDALAIFRMIAPEFANIPDEDILDDDGKVKQYGVKSYMELCAGMVSKKRFGENYEKALALLTAHNMKMQDLGSSNGLGIADSIRFASYSEGGASVSFGSSQQTNLLADAEYALTVYGIKYLTLRRNSIIPIISAGEGPPHGC